MATINDNNPPSQSQITEITSSLVGTLSAGREERGFACWCGATGTAAECTSTQRCPLGMPWSCGRQLPLPFAEPMERRRQ